MSLVQTRSRSSAWSPTCTRRGRSTIDAHPVPTGREEIWRFTPLKRLRGLHADAALDGTGVGAEYDAPDAVVVEPLAADSPLLGSSGFVPTDRIAARVWHESGQRFAVTVPADAELDRPVFVTLTGTDVEPATATHAVITAGAHSRATVVLRFVGSATLADNVEIVVGDGADLTVVSIDDWADDAVHVGHRHAQVGRDARFKHVDVTFGGSVVRHDSTAEYAGPGGDVEMLGLYFADAGQHIEHRLFVDHTAPEDQEPRDLQGRAAGRGRPHGLDRQRADPQGRRGHRDLRGEPQPRAHRRLPGRLGAQPRDRDRRDRGRRPRVRHRPLRRRAAVLPPLARHRRGRGTPPRRPRLLQRPDPPDRRTRARGAAGRDRRGRARQERPTPDVLGSPLRSHRQRRGTRGLGMV